jgi:hypothetical protein
MLATESRVSEAASLYRAVATGNPATGLEKDALLGLFYLYSSRDAYRSVADGIAGDLQKKYPTDPDVLQALWINRLQQGTTPSVSQKPGGPETNESSPQTFDLIQSYPNPFNPITTLHYQLPQDSRVRIVVYDVLGREVRTLVDEVKLAGSYAVQFDAKQIASGPYFCRMVAEPVSGGKGYVAVKKLMVLK